MICFGSASVKYSGSSARVPSRMICSANDINVAQPRLLSRRLPLDSMRLSLNITASFYSSSTSIDTGPETFAPKIKR
jgi:hypothetical protein